MTYLGKGEEYSHAPREDTNDNHRKISRHRKNTIMTKLTTKNYFQ